MGGRPLIADDLVKWGSFRAIYRVLWVEGDSCHIRDEYFSRRPSTEFTVKRNRLALICLTMAGLVPVEEYEP